MNQQNFTATITVAATPEQAYAAINNVRAWWSRSIIGEYTHVGDEFVQHVPDLHWARLRVAQLEPGRTVAWDVLDSLFPWVEQAAEWRGTQIRFELGAVESGTEIRFTHVGLWKEHECFDVCASAWGGYLGGSLKSLIETGVGSPNVDDVATTVATA